MLYRRETKSENNKQTNNQPKPHSSRTEDIIEVNTEDRRPGNQVWDYYTNPDKFPWRSEEIQ